MKKLLLIIALLQAIQANAQKNVIFLIGDGMGVSQIYAGLTANKGQLNLEKSQFIGFHKNQASNNYVTDSAAGATAFATGFQTYNSAIGVDSSKKPQITLLELAEKKRNGHRTCHYLRHHRCHSCLICCPPSTKVDARRNCS